MKLRLPTDRLGWITVAAYAVAAAIILWLVSAIFYRLIILPREAKQAKAETITQQETTKATGEAAKDAITVTNEVRREVIRIEEITRRNERAIQTAPGAETRAPDVARALRDGLCELGAYSGHPDCAAVPRPGGELGPARSDPGNGTPVE